MKEEKGKLYQIGEISKLCNIPIKTLRYYDEIDLFKPVKIDEETNYRYYSIDQLLYILIIKQFKDAGFSLKEIKKFLDRDDLEESKKKIEEKCIEIDNKINDLLRIKEKLKFFISDDKIERDDSIHIKYIPEIYIAYYREKGMVDTEEFALRYCKLQSLIEKNNLHITKNLMALYYDFLDSKSGLDNECDIEVCAEISEHVEIPGVVRKFGGFYAVSLMHYGKYDTMFDDYKRILKYIDDNNYKILGPAVDNYIVDSGVTIDEDKYITELLMPIKNF